MAETETGAGGSTPSGEAPKGKVWTQEEHDADVAGLKAHRDRVLDEKKALQKRYAGIPEDFDPEELKTLRAAKTERERADAEKKGEWDKLRDSLKAEHDKALETERKRSESLAKELNDQLIGGAAARYLAGLKPIEKSVPLLLRHIEANAVVVEEGGKRVVRIKDGDDYLSKGGEYVTLADFVKGLPDALPNLFEGDNKNGSGAVGSAGGGKAGSKTLTRAAYAALSAADKLAFSKAGGRLTDN